MELVEKLRVGMTRREVIDLLGLPEDLGGTSRKYRSPSILKYGQVELHFEPWKDGRLFLAYTEDEQGVGKVLLE